MVGSSGVLSERLNESAALRPPPKATVLVLLLQVVAELVAVAAASDKRPLLVWSEPCCFSFDCLCSNF